MRLYTIERPSALPAALMQFANALTAHVSLVGQTAVRRPQRFVLTQGSVLGSTGGSARKGIDRGQYVMAGASGVPPRGRPV